VAEAEAGRLNYGTPPTIEHWMSTYLSEVAATRVRPVTLHSYEQFARLYINPQLGQHRLDHLRPQHITAFYRELSRTLAPSSVRRVHAVLRRALTVAVRWGLMANNPTLLVDPPSIQTQRIQPYSVSEAHAFLAAAAHDRLEARWLIGLTLGLRQGEVLGLGWPQVDFDNMVISVERALQRQPDGALELVQTKTVRSRRLIPMPTSVASGLRRRPALQAADRELLGSDWHESDLVFTTQLGTPVHPRNDYRSFQRLIETAGLRRVRLHDLQHTAASLLLSQDVAARVVTEILVHSQISVTMNTYTYVDPALSRVATDRMEDLLWPTH
jgi:integrase